MNREFTYTIKLAVQHRVYGTLDYITKDFDSSVEIDNDGYYNPFVVNKDNVLNMMELELDKFLVTNKYDRKDIDIVSYEVTTDDPYVSIYFSDDEAENKHSDKPNIEAYIIPESLLPPTPQGFKARVIDDETIEWSWGLVDENTAYRLYNEEGSIIAEAQIDMNCYIEKNLEIGKNYTRKLVAFNSQGESDPTPFITMAISENAQPPQPLKELTLDAIKERERVPIEKGIEKLTAFKSGIGDGLDLLLMPINELKVYEKFQFDVMLEGFKKKKERIYTSIPFKYVAKAIGKKEVPAIDTKVSLKVSPYPFQDVKFSAKSYVYKPHQIQVECSIMARYTSLSGVSGEVGVQYNNTFNVNKPIKDQLILNAKEYIEKNSAIIAEAVSYEITSITPSRTNEYLKFTLEENFDLFLNYDASPYFFEDSIEKEMVIKRKDGEYVNILSSTDLTPINILGDNISITDNVVTEITYHVIGNRTWIYEEGQEESTYPTIITKNDFILVAKSIPVEIYYNFMANLNMSMQDMTRQMLEMFPSIDTSQQYNLMIEVMSKEGNGTISTTQESISIPERGIVFLDVLDCENDELKITGEVSTSLQDFMLSTPVISGNVNGNEPMLKEDDGKKSLVTVTPSFELPETTKEVYYTIEIVESRENKIVDIKFRNAIEYNKTLTESDIVVFSSDEYDMVDLFGEWSGPVIRTEEFEIKTAGIEQYIVNVYNPHYDPSTQDMELSDIRIKARSTNPNVYIEPIENGIIDFKNLGFKECFSFAAKVVSSSQNCWAPMIHPGYYYINNDEYFLHANPRPRGVYSVEDVPRVKEFFATIYADVVASNDSSLIFEKKYESKSSLTRGELHDVLIGDNAKITLEPKEIITVKPIDNTITKYAPQGYYITEAISFTQSIKQLTVAWLNENTSSPISCCVIPFYEDTQEWAEQTVVSNGVISYFDEDVSKFKLKFELRQSSVIEDKVYSKEISSFKEEGYSQNNIFIRESLLELADKRAPGDYTSEVIEISRQYIDTLSIGITANHEKEAGYDYQVQVAFADTYDELFGKDDVEWTDITEDMPVKRFMRYKINIPSSSGIAIYSVDCTFKGSNGANYETPILSNIAVSSIPPDIILGGKVTKTILCKLPMDEKYHDVTEFNLIDIIYPEIIAQGISNPTIKKIDIKTIDESVYMDFEKDGTSTLKAMSNTSEYVTIKSDYIAFDEKGEGLLYPIPQLGRPIIAEHDMFGPLRHVSFVDDEGNPTLENTQHIISDGTNHIALGYDYIDTDTLKVTIGENELSVTKIVDNIVYFKEEVQRDMELVVRYKVLNSFTIDYNHEVDEQQAKILVHISELIKDFDKIKVYYEINDADSWYYASEVQLNTLYNDINAGFVYLTDKKNVAKKLEIHMSDDKFDANGIDSAYMFVKAVDELGNPVSNTAIQVRSKIGKISLLDNITNSLGIVSVKYTAPYKEGTDIIKATCNEGLEVTKEISIIKPKSLVYICLNADKYQVNMNEAITLNVKVFKETLDPLMAVEVTCTINDKDIANTTNINGEVDFVIAPTEVGIMSIKVSSLGASESTNIKVVDANV